MNLPATTKTIKKSVYLTEQFKREAKAAGLSPKDTSEVIDLVAENGDEGEVRAQLQKDGVLTVRTLRWRDRFTVLYLSALDGRELYLLSLLEPKNPEPPSKNGSKRVMALLEKIGVQLVIEAIKWFFRNIKDKEELLDDLVSHRNDAAGYQTIEVLSNKRAIGLKEGLFVKSRKSDRRMSNSDKPIFSANQDFVYIDFCKTKGDLSNGLAESRLKHDIASDYFVSGRQMPTHFFYSQCSTVLLS